MGRSRWWVRVAVVGLLLGCGACIRREPTPDAPRGSDTGAGFFVAALPVYRLVTSEYLLDVPSRLLVLQVRMESTGSDSFVARAQDLAIILPDGTHGRIFDVARAQVLLRRSLLADADMSYLSRPDHQPGGVSDFSRLAVADMVAGRLLQEGSFGPGAALQGYVVIDTGQPLGSLDGTAFELVARRVGDDAPARYAQRLGGTPLPVETQ